MSKVSKRGGKITVSIPINDFIDEHKSIVKILNEGVPEKIIAEAENQRKELKEIIEKAKRIQMNKPNMDSDEVMGKLVDVHKEKALAGLRKVEAETKERNIVRRVESAKMKDIKRADEDEKRASIDKKVDIEELIKLIEDDIYTYSQLRKIASDNNITMSGKAVSSKENVKKALLAGLMKKL